LCPAPCAGFVTEERYGVLVDFAWRYVTAGREATLAALEERLDRLAGAGGGAPPPGGAPEPVRDPDDVAWERERLRECRDRLRRVRREYRPLDGGLGGGDLLMAYRAPDGGAVVYLVRDGRLRHRRQSSPEALNGESLAAGLAALLGDPGPAPDEAVLDDDQTSILLRWIYRRTGHPECIPVRPGDRPEDLAGAVLSALE